MPDDCPLTLCGWCALFEALALINEHDAAHAVGEINSLALTDYIARRRDTLVHHYFPQYRHQELPPHVRV